MKINHFLLCVACIFASGCSLFSTKPALPKQADRDAVNESTDQWALAAIRADIIYFPVEAINVASPNQSAAKMVRALRNSGATFSVGWLGIEYDNGNEVSHGEPRWSYSGQLRDQCKLALREAIDVRQLFLGLPAPIRTKLQVGSSLDENDKSMLPRGYHTPPGGLEDFAERLAAVRGLQERDVENLFRTHVATEQFAAEKIVSFTREHKGEKLLVFARRQDLTGDLGVPAFVAQKVKVRQLTLDLNRSHTAQPRLVSLSFANRGGIWF